MTTSDAIKNAKLIIFAVNVHQGGGAVLLNQLLSSIVQNDVSCKAFLDKRLQLSEALSVKIQTKSILPSIFARLSAELTLRNCANAKDTVLFFGNLPPLFKLNSTAILFIQNRYLIDNISLKHFKIKARLRITLERIWLKVFIKNIDIVIVQTPSMQSCVVKCLSHKAVVLPFIESKIAFDQFVSKTDNIEKTYDFLYVASGDPHKNHKQLVEAWVILAAEGIFPALCLTLDEVACREFLVWMRDKISKFGLRIVNVGFVVHSAVEELFKQAKAMIYPSTLESFGLPLIEARAANLPIIASELDYVRDLLDPAQTFDPSSPKSIARAVKRFLGYGEKPLGLVDPKSFLDFCINSNNKRN